MAKFCMSCGNPVDEGTVFCDNCGARLDGAPVSQQQAQPVTQYSQPPTQQAGYPQPSTGYPNQQYGSPQLPQQQKKSKGLMIGLIIGGVVIVAAIVLIIIFVLIPIIQPNDKPNTSNAPTSVRSGQISTEAVTETAVDAQPDFEKYSIVPELKVGDTFEYLTGNEGEEETIAGKVKLVSFTREPVSKEILDFGTENGLDTSSRKSLFV